MKLKNVALGRWFTYRGQPYLRSETFDHHGQEFMAQSLIHGTTAFPLRSSDDIDVELINKPDWALTATGTMRFDTHEQRKVVEERIHKAHPYVEFALEDYPGGVYFLNFTTTGDLKSSIMVVFGRG